MEVEVGVVVVGGGGWGVGGGGVVVVVVVAQIIENTPCQSRKQPFMQLIRRCQTPRESDSLASAPHSSST